MPLSTTSSAKLQIQQEAEFGTVNANDTTHKVKDLRFTGESLAFAISKTESTEIRSDRQLADLISTSAEASGGVNMELSYKEYDDLLQAVMMGTWAVYGTNGVGTAFSADFATNSITVTAATTAPSGTSDFTTLKKGQWIKINTTGDNNGKIVRISSTTAPTSTVITLDAATPLVAGSAVTGTTLSSSRLENGSTQRSFSIERSLTDVSQFFMYRGMTVSSMNLKIASGSITSGSFEFMGKDAVRAGSSNYGTNTPVTSATYDVHNGVSGVGHVFEGGAKLSGTHVKSIDFTIDNSLRARDAIGTLGNVSIGNGQCKVTGTMEVYLADGTLYDKFLNNTTTSIQVSTKDGDGNGYVFQFPAVKYGDAKVNAGGKDQDIMISLPFTAILDSSSGSTGKTVLVDRFGVAV